MQGKDGWFLNPSPSLIRSGAILLCVCVCVCVWGGEDMEDSFFNERARQVREIATKADPFTNKRLLGLASRYECSTTKRATPCL